MKKVVIDRGRWLRGEGARLSRLLRSSDNKMCCLGFVLKTEGRTDEELRDARAPGSTQRSDFTTYEPITPPGKGTTLLLRSDDGTYRITESVGDAMLTNDDSDITDEQREAHLIELLRHSGYELEFVDGTP